MGPGDGGMAGRRKHAAVTTAAAREQKRLDSRSTTATPRNMAANVSRVNGLQRALAQHTRESQQQNKVSARVCRRAHPHTRVVCCAAPVRV